MSNPNKVVVMVVVIVVVVFVKKIGQKSFDEKIIHVQKSFLKCWIQKKFGQKKLAPKKF